VEGNSNEILKGFLEERWKGIRPILWGSALKEEELIEGVDDGLYICGRGARGGEVDVGLGTFTFRAGPSYVIRS
jgi:hypothetical protein